MSVNELTLQFDERRLRDKAIAWFHTGNGIEKLNEYLAEHGDPLVRCDHVKGDPDLHRDKVNIWVVRTDKPVPEPIPKPWESTYGIKPTVVVAVGEPVRDVWAMGGHFGPEDD